VYLEVDPAALRRIASDLSAATDVAQQVHSGTANLESAAAAAGNASVTAAAEHFRSTWSYGLNLIVSDAKTLHDMLTQAAAAYTRNEDAIAGGFGG
jgi:Excreted virulence factor EspC, type VII ESX diderm